MPKYSFTAVNLDNKRIKDTLEAKDDFDLRRILRERELVPIRYKALENLSTSYRLKPNEVAEFSRQLASMLSSGITAVRALEILKDRDFKPQITKIYQRLHKDVSLGYTLSEAMRMQNRAFPELLINMYASGEASGQLERVTSKMATHYEKEHRLNGKVKSAMTYPAILFVVTVVVVLIIFILILPEFFNLFEEMELPTITQFMFDTSTFLQSQWYWVVIVALCAVALSRYLISLRPVALKVDYIKLRLPIAGKLLKIIYTARFSRTLSSLYSSGISMLNALEITATIINNKHIEQQFEEVIKNVRNGEPLSESVGRVDGFDVKLVGAILIGEESGRLDSMLESIAESFDYEAESATLRLTQLVEPIMIVVMAVIIGFIMLSVMLPLMNVYQQAGSY